MVTEGVRSLALVNGINIFDSIAKDLVDERIFVDAFDVEENDVGVEVEVGSLSVGDKFVVVKDVEGNAAVVDCGVSDLDISVFFFFGCCWGINTNESLDSFSFPDFTIGLLMLLLLLLIFSLSSFESLEFAGL